VIKACVIYKSVKNDLDCVIFSDVLMLFVSAVFTKQSVALNILFKTCLLFFTHFLEDFEKLDTDEFRPIKSLFVIVFLKIFGTPSQNSYVFRSK